MSTAWSGVFGVLKKLFYHFIFKKTLAANALLTDCCFNRKGKTREEKKRHEKRREDKTRQEKRREEKKETR